MKKYENFCKALTNLHEGMTLTEPYTVVEQTGIVGLFGICFEQALSVITVVKTKYIKAFDELKKELDKNWMDF